MKTVVVIPVFNEAPVIRHVIQSIQNQGYSTIFVVDDGSHDGSYQVAQQQGAVCLRHKLNRGKGAAMQTGMMAALQLEADVIITMDGDGQHDPADIQHLIAPILQQECDVVLGSRLHDTDSMPTSRQWSNKLANAVTWLIHGLWVADSQSGFRAYSRRALEAINPQADRYEYDSAVIREIRHHNLSWQEVPITVRYTAYSTSKPYRQSVSNALHTLRAMLWKVLS